MASRTATKDIITLRGSAAIVSEFFGNLPFGSSPFILIRYLGLISVSMNLDWSVCSFVARFQVMLQTGMNVKMSD